MSKKIKSAIIGLGRIASTLEEDPKREKPCTHAGAISINPHCELVGGCDIDPEKNKKFSEKWKVENVFTDPDEMFKKTKPDILHIAAYPESRWQLVKKACEYKVPVIVCEKPLSDNLKDAKKIMKLHQSGKVKILVNHERRYSGDYIKIKKLIDEKKYGNIVSVNAKVFIGKTKRLLDMLWHDGTHMIDIISYLTGSALKFDKYWGNVKNRESSFFIMAKSSSVPVLVELGASRDYLVFELEISFESGRVRIGNGIFEIQESKVSKYYDGFKSLSVIESSYNKKTGYFSGMQEDAVACFNDNNREPISSAVDGYNVIAFLSKISKWNS